MGNSIPNRTSLFPNRTNNSLFPNRTNNFSNNSSKAVTLAVPYKIKSEHSRSFSTKTDTDSQLNLLNNSSNNNSFLVTNSFLLRGNFSHNNSSSNQDSFKIPEVSKPVSNC